MGMWHGVAPWLNVRPLCRVDFSQLEKRAPELTSKAVVDLDRYMGRWWVIGNIPYFAERWKIAFFGGLLKADYLILEVAPDYSWAPIGQPSGKLAWVFSRDQRMDDAQFNSLKEKFAAYGYRPDDIERVPQFPDQQK